MTTIIVIIASCVPLINLPNAHLEFKCNVFTFECGFYFKFNEYFKFEFIFFDSPTKYVTKLLFMESNALRYF